MHLIFFITLPLDMGVFQFYSVHPSAKMQNYKIKIANIPWDLLKGCTKCRNICKQTASHCFPPSFIVLVQLVFEPSVKEKKKFNHMGLKHCPSVISTKFTKCNGDYSKKKNLSWPVKHLPDEKVLEERDCWHSFPQDSLTLPFC